MSHSHSAPRIIGECYVNGNHCSVIKDTYYNGPIALRLVDYDTGELFATATVNLAYAPRKGHVFIKDYSENDGVLQGLTEVGLIGEPVKLHSSGWVTISECPLLVGED